MLKFVIALRTNSRPSRPYTGSAMTETNRARLLALTLVTRRLRVQWQYFTRPPALGGLPVDSINFLAAYVADEKGRIVWSEPCPRSQISPIAAHAVQTDQPFQLAV